MRADRRTATWPRALVLVTVCTVLGGVLTRAIAQPPGASASQGPGAAGSGVGGEGPAPGAPPPGPPGRNKDVKGPPPRASDKVYAFEGSWSVIESGRPQTPVPAKGFIAFKPRWEAKRAELERQDKAGEVIKGRNSRCIPSGMPDMMTFGFNVYTTNDYLVVIGGYGTTRPVWLKRKEHTPSKALFPTYQGESIGHWEGNTLVIDTVGLDATNEITYALPADDPNVHIVERWTMTDKNTLKVVISVDSPLSMDRPWIYTMVYARQPESGLVGEVTYCDRPLVNNEMDLTPPSGGYVPPGAAQ